MHQHDQSRRPKSANQVMKNKLKSVRKGSKTAAAPQPKTTQSRAILRPESDPPCIALFPEGDTSVSEEIIDLTKAEFAALKRAAEPGGAGVLMFMANAALEKAGRPSASGHQPARGSHTPSCLCFFDGGVVEVTAEIPLVGREIPGVVVAAARMGITVDQFIADAIRKKIGAVLTAEISKTAVRLVPKSSPPNPPQETDADNSSFRAQCKLENAVYEAIGCIYLLKQSLEQKIIEDSGDVSDTTAAGICYVSESASETLLTAFNSIRHQKQHDQRRAA